MQEPISERYKKLANICVSKLTFNSPAHAFQLLFNVSASFTPVRMFEVEGPVKYISLNGTPSISLKRFLEYYRETLVEGQDDALIKEFDRIISKPAYHCIMEHVCVTMDTLSYTIVQPQIYSTDCRLNIQPFAFTVLER
jgi:hypothetical protein